MLEDLKQKLEELLSPIVRIEGCELIDLLLLNQGGRLLLRFLIDKQGGVTLDECANMNKKISIIIEREDFVERSYVVEVSSPGIDRPLKKEQELRCAIGRNLLLTMKSGEVIAGNLLEVKKDKILLTSNERLLDIMLSDVEKIKQDFKMPEV